MTLISSTEKFLIGHVSEEIPDKKLPTGRDVLKYLHFRKCKEKKKNNFDPQREILICCKWNGKGSASCGENESCSEQFCTVRAVKVPWEKAGFPVISDKGIR